ncbi:MAG: hypothetical protein KGO82_16110, partial [Bacteroidota bacterium]|nr:hypothetical protein [Bacteroidota bacterium]
MSKQPLPFILVIVSLLLASCSNTKYLPAGEVLYTGSKVIVHSTGEKDRKDKDIRQALAGMTRPRPNRRTLGLRWRLWIYNIAGNPKKESSLRGKLKYKIGEPPVLLNSVSLDQNSKILANYLQNQGFLQATVAGDTLVKNKRAQAIYTATTGHQYTINSIGFDSGTGAVTRSIAATAPESLLKKGKAYNLEVMKAERERIDAQLKEKGFFYFNPDYIYVSADTGIGKYAVDLGIHLKPTMPRQAARVWTVNDIYIFSNYRLGGASQDTLKDTGKVYKGYHIIDRKNQYKPQLFYRTMLFSPGDVYKRSLHNLTINRLITLGLFKFVKNRFENDSTTDSSRLNTYYYLTPSPKKSLRAELNGNTKSNNLTGSQISISWRNRNAFRGGEQLSITGLGGFEVQYAGQYKGFNT